MCTGGLVQLLMMLAKPRTKLIHTNQNAYYMLIRLIIIRLKIMLNRILIVILWPICGLLNLWVINFSLGSASSPANWGRPQSEIYRRGNVENGWNSSVVRRSSSKAIIGFPIISDYFQCRKCRSPDAGPRRKCQGFCALKSSEFRLKHALSFHLFRLTN